MRSLEYLAGFFDGEGSVGAYAPDWRITLHVAGTDEPSIRLFLRFGGFVYPMKGRTENRKPYWVWCAQGALAKFALGEMLPYLTVKKAQAFEALKSPVQIGTARLTAEDRALRREIASRLKALKKVAA